METQEQTYMDPAYYHAMMLNTDFMSQSLFQETACDECKAQHQSRHPGIHNFHAFLCYVLAKPISCCVYACSFIQRMIEFPLYETTWRQYYYVVLNGVIESWLHEAPVRVLFVQGEGFESSVLVWSQDTGTIHCILQGHLTDRRFILCTKKNKT